MIWTKTFVCNPPTRELGHLDVNNSLRSYVHNRRLAMVLYES